MKTIEEIQQYIENDKSLYGYIKRIYEDDYGCEERLENAPKMLLLEIITDKNTLYKRIVETELDRLGYQEGTYISIEAEEYFV